jgi:hypothetical protein
MRTTSPQDGNTPVGWRLCNPSLIVYTANWPHKHTGVTRFHRHWKHLFPCLAPSVLGAPVSPAERITKVVYPVHLLQCKWSRLVTRAPSANCTNLCSLAGGNTECLLAMRVKTTWHACKLNNAWDHWRCRFEGKWRPGTWFSWSQVFAVYSLDCLPSCSWPTVHEASSLLPTPLCLRSCGACVTTRGTCALALRLLLGG